MTAHFDCYDDDDDDDDEAMYEEQWRDRRRRYMQSLPIHRRIATMINVCLETMLSREVGRQYFGRERRNPWWFKAASRIEFALRPYTGKKKEKK